MKLPLTNRQAIIAWGRQKAVLGTQKQVAAKYGISVQYVQAILAADRAHQRSKLKRIAGVLS